MHRLPQIAVLPPSRDGSRPPVGSPIAAALLRWTGQRWVVSVSREAGAPTLDAAVKAATETRRENAAADPFVREVLTRFPGAEIVDVRETAPPSTAEPEISADGDTVPADETPDEDF